MDIPEAFWDWDFRRQRAWFMVVLPGAPYDKIEAGHGTALAAALDNLPREFCNLSAPEQEAYLHWEQQVNSPRPPAGWRRADAWSAPSDRAQVAVALAAACREGMLNTLGSGAASIAAFRDDARVFGGATQLSAWARAHPSAWNEDAVSWVAGRQVGTALRAAAYVYPAGQVATRRLHAPVRRTRRRPRLSVQRTTSGRVTVTPTQTVRSTPTPAPQAPFEHPPQPPEGYQAPPPSAPTLFGPPIVVGPPPSPAPAPAPPSSTPTPASFRPTAPAAPPVATSAISPLWIVGGLAVVAVGGYLILRPSTSTRGARRGARGFSSSDR